MTDEANDQHTDDELEVGAAAPTEGLIASREANAALEHSTDPTGPTTRSDATDAGVPMLAGDPNEPIGPEDAFGPGVKRGKYDERETGSHTTAELIPESERGPAYRFVHRETGAEVEEGHKQAVRVPVERPRTRLVDQVARAGEQGEAPGKGGVPGTAPREDVAVGG